jgi:hypothetical protein
MNKEFKRMQELAGLDEIKVNRPASNIDILNKMLEPNESGDTFDNFFSTISFYDSLEDWINDEGLDEEDPDDAAMIQLGKRYFMWVDRNDIYVFTVDDEGDLDNIVFPKPYKKAITYGLGYNNAKIIMHNF